MRSTDAVEEARREIEICNACRYCEGYCAVFPAMELRREFTDSDLGYLANLCHDCRGCFYACQFTPPHEFAIDLPKAFAALRAETYATHAWPRGAGALFARSGTLIALATAGGMALVLIAATLFRSPAALAVPRGAPGAFYAVIPESAMIAVALCAFLYAVVAVGAAMGRFWRSSGALAVVEPGALAVVEAGAFAPEGAGALRAAIRDALTLRYLGGGGAGCHDRDERFSVRRRRFHHALFYGFTLCFASTLVAAAYEHLLGRLAPYPVLSLPVILGTVGGIGMTVGAAGLLALKIMSDPEPTERRLIAGEYALLVQLLLAAVTGLLLLALRGTAAMGPLLAIHLGVILSFFVTAPYSKFVHGAYRSAALLRNALETRNVNDQSRG